MKTGVLAALVVLAGVVVGGGSSFATDLILGSPAGPATPAPAPAALPPTFVPTGRILAPLVAPDGHLAGYVQFEAQLETAPDRGDFVKLRLPLLMHAINMRTYRTPMTSGPDGLLPNLDTFRRLMLAAASETFGPDEIKRVAITQAAPA